MSKIEKQYDSPLVILYDMKSAQFCKWQHLNVGVIYLKTLQLKYMVADSLNHLMLTVLLFYCVLRVSLGPWGWWEQQW